jgi:hypothetical protein
MAKKPTKKSKMTNSNNGGDSDGSATPGAQKSKTAIAKEYIQDHPEVGNKEVLTALIPTVPNLTYADVANARSILSKKSKKRGKPAAGKKSDKKVAAEIRPIGGTPFMSLVKQAAEFSRAAGGIDQAIALLQTLQSIRQM